MAEIIINDNNWQDFVNPVIQGDKKLHGLKPRNYSTHPVGYSVAAPEFDMDLIPENEYQSRLDEQKANGNLIDIRNSGMFGQQMPSVDQNGRGYCHTADTEVLTEKGWTQWSDYNYSDLLATVNPSTHMMEFQAPFEKHVYDYDGEMIYSTNRRIDFGVTPDHRMMIRKWDENKRTLSKDYSIQRAGNLGWYVGLLHAPIGHFGTELIELGIQDDRNYDGDDLLALIAIVTSCGYAGGTENTKNWVSFCCFDENRYEKLAALAYRVGFHESPGRKGVFVRYDAPALAEWFRRNAYISGKPFNAIYKRIPDIVKVASVRQIKHFLDFYGDKDHTNLSSLRFYSSSKRLVDDLQELHLRIGVRSTISLRDPRQTIWESGIESQCKEAFVLTISSTECLCLDKKKHIETDHYKGLVYCAAVPNGTLITRRNGTTLISHNCWAHSGVSAMLLARAVNHQPYVDLSAYAVACMIKNFRDEGGWGLEGIEFMAGRGVPSSQFWPQRSVNRSNNNQATWDNAHLHRWTEWMDGEPRNKAQLITCLLLNIPVVSDFNWWSHSVCTLAIKQFKPVFQTYIWNSWGDEAGENGIYVLEGNRAIPDGMVMPRIVSASQA